MIAIYLLLPIIYFPTIIILTPLVGSSGGRGAWGTCSVEGRLSVVGVVVGEDGGVALDEESVDAVEVAPVRRQTEGGPSTGVSHVHVLVTVLQQHTQHLVVPVICLATRDNTNKLSTSRGY